MTIERSDIGRHIAAHIAARRIERRLTQQQVAEGVGVSRQALSMIERGTQLPSWQTIYRIAQLYRCEVFELIPRVRQVRS